MAKKPSNPITKELVRKIKAYLASGNFYQHQIASFVEVNQGRISEVKKGIYDWMLGK